MSFPRIAAVAALLAFLPLPFGGSPPAAAGTLCDTTIEVLKFYDLDLDGIPGDPALEPPIPDWHVELWCADGHLIDCGLTDADGLVTFVVPMDGQSYFVIETLVCSYLNTTPLCRYVTASVEWIGVRFGNVCVEPRCGLGRTPGFWQSRNNPHGRGVVGYDLLAAADPEWRTLLNDLPLVWPNGSPLVIPTAAPFDGAFGVLKDWINGKAKGNMAFILSRQLAASALNLLAGPLSALEETLALYCGGSLWPLEDILDSASSLLAGFPLTPGGSAGAIGEARSDQERIKDCLDAANSNEVAFLAVLPEPCPFEPVPCVCD